MIFTFKKYFVQQTDYQHWANDALFAALDTLEDEVRRSPQGLPYQSIHNTVDHALVMTRNWVSRLKGENEVIGYEVVLYPDWRELKNALRAELRGLQRWLEASADDFFDDRLTFPSGSQQRSMWVRDALTHVLTNLAHHRGLVAGIARRRGAPAPEFDYAYYKLEIDQHMQAIRKQS